MADLDDADTYGERWADVYDDEHGFMDSAPAIALLAELANGQPTLELGIGTGRVALPLRELGVDIRGLDASPSMVARLRLKRGGDAIEVAFGDMASADLGGPYGLIFVAFNTFFALLTQELRIQCFRNVAAALLPGGRFVTECFVPDLTRFRDGDQTVRVVTLDDSRVRLNASVHDPGRQIVRAQVIVLQDAAMWNRPVALRYCWPTEMDLMGRLAGLQLKERWSGWERQPFTNHSTQHVSVYQRPTT